MFSCFCSWFHWIDCEYICPGERGTWSHWSDFEYTFTCPEGLNLAGYNLNSFWSGALMTTATSNVVMRSSRALNFWASREEPENQCCAMWEVTNANDAWKFSFFKPCVDHVDGFCFKKGFHCFRNYFWTYKEGF